MRITLTASMTALLGGVGAGVSWAHASGIFIILSVIVTLAAAIVAIWAVGAGDSARTPDSGSQFHPPRLEAPQARNSAAPGSATRQAERPVGA